MAKRLDPAARYGLRLTLLIAAFVLVTVPFATLLFQVLAEGPLTRFDGNVADALNGFVHDNDWLIGPLQAISWMGRPPILWALTIAGVAYTWHNGARKLTAFLLCTTIGGGIMSTAVKVLVDRPRPEVDHPITTAFGKSFPSGHALSSTVVYGAVLLTFLPVIAPRLRHLVVGLVAALVLLIGASRLLLGVHFVTDVTAGYLLGVAWLAGATAMFEIWRIERGKRPAKPLDEGVEPEEAKELAS